MTRSRAMTSFLCSLGALCALYACTTPQPAAVVEEDATAVEIDRAVHFLTPEGNDIVVLPGEYEVRAESNGLRLLATGQAEAESLVIDAQPGTHDEAIQRPVAVALPEDEDGHVISLLLPNSHSLDARGSYSGLHSRAVKRPRVSSAGIRQRLQARRSTALLQAQLALSSASLKYAGQKRVHQARKSKNTWRLPVNDTIASGSFTFGWSGYPGATGKQALPAPGRIADIQTLIKKRQCCVKLFVNGKTVPLTKSTLSRNGTLLTTAQLSNATAKTWPKTVKLVVTKGGKTWKSASAKIYANTISYYATVLHPIFSHDRCTACHALGTRAAIVNMHNERLGEGSYPDTEDVQPHNPDFCGSCHSIPPGSEHTDMDLNNEWFSPAAVQGLNWKRWDASRVCHKVTGPFTNKDGVVGPPVDLTHHFHDDPRILWAVSSGWVPFGRPDLPVPMKNNLQGWFNKVDPWVAAGAPCPPKSKFFPRSRVRQPRLSAPRR